MHAPLAIMLLGSFCVTLDGAEVSAWESNRVRALLAYLAIERKRPHSRDVLANLLWPDQIEEAAASNLRQTLTRLRRALGDGQREPPCLAVTRHTIQLNPATPVSVDVDQFIHLLDEVQHHRHRRAASCPVCFERLQRAAELYGGDFLVGFVLEAAAPFDDWLTDQRMRLQEQMLDALTQLAQGAEERGRYEQVRAYATRQLTLEPWREEAHRQLMRAYTCMGRRGAALAQFQACRQVLRAEFDAEPEAATTALGEAIRRGATFGQESAPADHNLHLSHTPFVGREEELARIRERLVDPHYRLLTLLGPGGIGKTRLALQVANEQRGVWRDGVWWVALGGVLDAEALVPLLAQLWGLEIGHPDVEQQLFAYLRPRELLLILDNFQQVGNGAEWIVKLLDHAPHVAVVVTSRERLNLQAEYIVSLGGLAVPSNAADPQASSYAAVQLFAERADRILPAFALTPATLPTVVELCRLVGGLPLGIELGAATFAAMTAAGVTEVIQTNLDVLQTSMHDIPEHHRGLRAIFEYPWSALGPAEQTLFADLSVFAGPFRVEVAQAVTAASPATLARLHARSLLHQVGNAEYEVHEVLRRYAEEKLRTTTDRYAQVHDQLAVYYATFLQEQEPRLQGPERRATLQVIDRELRHVRQAWEWVLEARRLPLVEQLLPLLHTCLLELFRYAEGEAVFARAAEVLATARGQGGPEADQVQRLRGLALARQGFFCLQRRRLSQSHALLTQGLALLRPLATDTERLTALIWLSGSLIPMGEYAEARAILHEALLLSETLGDDLLRAKVLERWGAITAHEGDDATATRYNQAALAIYEAKGDLMGMRAVLSNLGTSAYTTDDYPAAEHYYRRSLALSEAQGDLLGIALAYANLGGLEELLGNYVAARAYLERAIPLFRQLDHAQGLAFSLKHLALCMVALADHAQVMPLYREALELASSGQLVYLVLTILTEAATALTQPPHSSHAVEALVVAAHVLHHPVADEGTADVARELETVLLEHLEPAVAAEAQAQGRRRTTEEVTAEMLALIGDALVA